ncbi:MAG: nucleoside-diphosphate sugar epimerase/dehydratase [Pseudomonadota bacterium]|nr:nucleoside-diphosphate sugar epimerase/dehydratase [Pseudomonadota bacterium]
MRNSLQDLLDDLSRRRKQSISVVADLVMLPLCLYVAFALRLGDWTPNVAPFWSAFIVCVGVAIPTFTRLGLYRQVVRYMGNYSIIVMIKGSLVTATSIGVLSLFTYYTRTPFDPVFPRSVPVIFWLLILLYTSGSRFAVRGYLQRLTRSYTREPVIIYGAGSQGAELVRLLKQQAHYQPIAFIDDDRKLQKSSIDDLIVHPPRLLEKLLKDHDVKQVLVAVSRDSEGRRDIVEFLENFAVRIRLIPDISELMAGTVNVANLRDVGIEDLLGRDEVEPLEHLLSGSVKQQNVLVTGAGGSIGAELCRQILQQEPSMLVLMDMSEFSLFEIHRELTASAEAQGLTVPIGTVLGSVSDVSLMRRTFNRYQVETIYHAAAYKHVGLVENNVIQGIKNNTFGTLYCAQAAMDCGVSKFILISTDKAVRTTSVMGATKRMSEMILQALQQESEKTRFAMVRFGNVLGSSGSVVPLFSEQIDRGGPLTVTHPEVTRYFMTIPEAAQLVLQAASMGDAGDIFMLDMGQPIKIIDLAYRMVRLKGLSVKNKEHPLGDIEIEFTGLKPGEKLHEELLVGGGVTGTEHRKIMRAQDSYLPWTELRGALATLEQACDTFDYGAIKQFLEGLVEGADLEAQLEELSPLADNVVSLKRPE